MVWTGTQLIVFGGTANGTTMLADGAIYDATTDAWTAITATDAPVARSEAVAVWSGTHVIVWGGVGNGGALADGAMLDPDANTWPVPLVAAVGAPTARAGAAGVFGGGRMFLFGGYDGATAKADGGAYEP
jgi:hypothetical protein